MQTTQVANTDACAVVLDFPTKDTDAKHRCVVFRTWASAHLWLVDRSVQIAHARSFLVQRAVSSAEQSPNLDCGAAVMLKPLGTMVEVYAAHAGPKTSGQHASLSLSLRMRVI